jgi:hypothetical protein
MRPAHASRLTWWSRRRPAPIARRAWERLAAAGSEGDPAARAEVIAIATTGLAGHPRSTEARAAIASWWVSSRDPGLREVVRARRMLASSRPDRWVTLALHKLLLAQWGPGAAAALPSLLTDADPAVREGAEAACAEAAEPILGELWRAVGDASSGLEALTRNENSLCEDTLEIAISRSANVPGEWLVAAAMAIRTPERLHPALVAACRERGLAPADPAERAAFYLLTGQLEHYRAADPDGALVTAAYEGASNDERIRLRTAMIRSGDLDLIRMLAGDDSRWQEEGANEAERAAVVRVLAARANWPELWRVTPSLPLIEAVAAVGLFDGWQPPDAHDRALFDRLARVDPGRLTTALSSPRVRSLLGPEPVRACAVSPDGSRLAVAGGLDGIIDQYSVRSGKRVATHTAEKLLPYDARECRLIHTGDSFILGWNGDRRSALNRLMDAGTWWNIHTGSERLTALAPTGSGFVASFTGPTYTYLLFGTRDGRLARPAPLPLALIAGRSLDHDQFTPGALATRPDTGLMALGGRELVVLTEDARNVVARAEPPGELHQVVFTGPDTIVTADRNDTLTRWELAGHTLTPMATAELADAQDLAALPVLDLIALRVGGNLVFRNAGTLAPVQAFSGIPHRGRLWCSLVGGPLFVVSDGLGIEVLDPIAVLARRPLGDTTPAALADVEKAIAEPGEQRTELLQLLHACLHHRFGSEIALGSAQSTATDHDIALGTAEGPR